MKAWFFYLPFAKACCWWIEWAVKSTILKGGGKGEFLLLRKNTSVTERQGEHQRFWFGWDQEVAENRIVCINDPGRNNALLPSLSTTCSRFHCLPWPHTWQQEVGRQWIGCTLSSLFLTVPYHLVDWIACQSGWLHLQSFVRHLRESFEAGQSMAGRRKEKQIINIFVWERSCRSRTRLSYQRQ